jgi:hypothetical protein
MSKVILLWQVSSQTILPCLDEAAYTLPLGYEGFDHQDTHFAA